MRVHDFDTNTVTTIAGGATGLSAPYGDGGAARFAQFANPIKIALGPDNAIYVTDASHSAIRRIDLAPPNIITTYLQGSANATACATSPVALSSCTTACDLAWSGGSLYVFGTLCGTAPGNAFGVVRRNADTSLTHIAGKVGGATAEGTAATNFQFTTPSAMAFDSGGAMYLVESHRVRKVSGGMVTTFAGTGVQGDSGDYGPATSAQLATPVAITTTPSGHVLISDTGNSCVREVW